MSLGTTQVSVAVSSSHIKSMDLGDATFPISLTSSITLLNGTGAGAADLVFTDTRTITASPNQESLDLSGSLVDVYGATITFARIKAIIVSAASANTANVHVVRPAATGVPLFLAAGDGIAVRPGGAFAWFCADATGVAVGGGSSDLLTISGSAGTSAVTYTIIIIGASA